MPISEPSALQMRTGSDKYEVVIKACAKLPCRISD